MAVDTRNRRFSCLGFGQPYGTSVVFPNPDGTIDSSDRSQYIYLYSGISLAAGHPTMARWGGVPHVRLNRPIAGRSW